MRAPWQSPAYHFPVVFAAAAIPVAMMAAGTVLGASGQIQAGNAAAAQGLAQQQAENYKAGVLTQQAGQERAAGQRAAEIQRRQATLVNSTIRARAAASGAGATDPSVVTNEGRVAGMGEYNALSALYSGEEKARGEENQAALDVNMGDQEAAAGRFKQSASRISALSSLLSGGGSLYGKYGGGGGAGGGLDANTLSTLQATSPGDI